MVWRDILLVLPLDAARAAAAEGAVQGKVDVLLAVDAHQEGGHIHDLLAHPAACRSPQSTTRRGTNEPPALMHARRPHANFVSTRCPKKTVM